MNFTWLTKLYFIHFCLPDTPGRPLAMTDKRVDEGGSMPGPFTRKLMVEDPMIFGKDVVILQNLLQRFPGLRTCPTTLKITAQYDQGTADAVSSFQAANNVNATGIFDDQTAHLLLDKCLSDGFKDMKTPLMGYKFKLYVPVFKDRNRETNATLYDADGLERFKFRIRAHGALDKSGNAINQLTTNGNTPTGLMTFDLNSPVPEPYRKSFGPYPVLRCVRGLKGNAAIGDGLGHTLHGTYRSGILLHTGEWQDWDPSKNMPNSLGCMKCHPEDQKKIVEILTNKLNVTVRHNPLGKQPYPYVPQGLIAIEQQD